MPAENMHTKKITARIRRDLFHLHILKKNLYILLHSQSGEYMKKYLVISRLFQINPAIFLYIPVHLNF